MHLKGKFLLKQSAFLTEICFFFFENKAKDAGFVKRLATFLKRWKEKDIFSCSRLLLLLVLLTFKGAMSVHMQRQLYDW